jgi:hypothetical protein
MISIETLKTMAALPLLMGRHPCSCQAGIVALLKNMLLPLIGNDIVALVAMASLPSSSWCVALVAMALSSSSMHSCPCHHHDGVVALIAMVLLPLMRRHLHHCCDGNYHSHRDGVSAVDKLA